MQQAQWRREQKDGAVLHERAVLVTHMHFSCPDKAKSGALQDKQSLVGVWLLPCVAHSCKLTRSLGQKQANFVWLFLNPSHHSPCHRCVSVPAF